MVEHGSGGDRGLTSAALAFVQCTTLDTVRLVVPAFRTAEAVTALAGLVKKCSAGLIGGVLPGPFEIADFCLFHFCISFIISMIYIGDQTIFNLASLT